MGTDDIPLDLPDAVSFYDRYLSVCERLGIEPVAPRRASQLIEQWNALFSDAGESAPATRH